MLSRIAESLYWVGRYLERAEDTARLLDVQINQLLEDAAIAEERASAALLSVMGIAAPAKTALDLGEVTGMLAFSSSEPSSIISSLRGARENARSVRESISSELWECLNSTMLNLNARVASAQAVGPHEFFRFALFVRERVAIAAGIADCTMSRDDGWRFLVLGRSIERIDMTARLLSVRLSDEYSGSDWATTLRSCSAYEAFLRTYRGAVNAINAIEFLLLDRYFPRSVYFSLASAQSCLAELEPARGRVGAGDEAQRIIGIARTNLEYRTIAELARHLPEHLESLQLACSQSDQAIARHYFQRDSTLAWRTDGSSIPVPETAS